MRTRFLPLLLLPMLLATVALAAGPNLQISKHNLALSSPGKLKSSEESDMCVFCHTTHKMAGEKAMWNHSLSGASYIPYSSTTMKAAVGQPTGDSKLCLSCHDGTVALGMVKSRKRKILTQGPATMPPGPARLGTDLSDDHPVSFTYDSALAAANPELKDPVSLINRVRLDGNNQVQCTSCHDPHNNQNGKFLVQNNQNSALCLNCHSPNLWSLSAHKNSGRSWNGAGRNPWPKTGQKTVAANGCENCHTPHSAGTHQRLLNLPQAEDNCLVCHSGSVATKNLANEFNKPSAHPVLTTSSLHDAAEDPTAPKSRHAACADCHNPHAANSTPAIRPNASGALAAVPGVSASGAPLKTITREYELCFRCHGDGLSASRTRIIRASPQSNLRLELAPANASYHPVLAPGKNGRVSSLVAPWTATSLVYCTDCHNNDQGPGAGGAGPKGPHGSAFAPLLERNLVQVDFQTESPAAYALCYKCHSESVLMADRLHSDHVRDAKTSCSTCHDAHGVQNQQHLINFNTLYVKPLNGRLSYTSLGPGNDSCTLSCHGTDHAGSSYSAVQSSAAKRLKRK
jgi:predicted CXXCH cytochrome family protein